VVMVFAPVQLEGRREKCKMEGMRYHSKRQMASVHGAHVTMPILSTPCTDAYSCRWDQRWR